ncbi:fatty acid desaturase family protein [Jatrophihabitans sp. YIM 134969]
MTAVLPAPVATATLTGTPSRSRAKTESDFGPLVALVKEHDLLRRRRGMYVASVLGDSLLLVATVVILLAAGGSWWALCAAAPLALWSARIGFLGHDAGHRQVARTPQMNRRLGLVLANVLSGMSQGWWDRKHNRHHANPNDVEKDPDVGTGVIAWTPEQAADDRNGVLKWLAAHQGYAFIPMLTLEGLNLKVASAQDVWKRKAWGEIALLLTHAVLYFGLLSLVLSPLQVVAFFFVHQAIFGLHLGLAFAPNHKGMPMPQPGEHWTHLQRQVLTSRNVRPHPLTDWLMGGLNYQVEHHLFPSIPRHSMGALKPLVMAHCETQGLPYTETSAPKSYAIALAYLHEVGTELR